MKIHYICLLAALAAMSTGCHKETNELAHHHHHSHEAHEEHEGHDHDHEGEDHDHEGHEHEHEHEGEEHEADVIVLNPAVADRMGVATDTSAMRPFGQVVKVSGQILPAAEGNGVVSAPTSGILTFTNNINVGSEVRAGQTIATVKADGVSGGDANRAAKVELDAAKAEFDRVDALYKDRLVTLAQYNAAKAALERAKAAFSAPAASGRVSAPISGIVTSLDAQTGQFVETGSPVATIASATRLTLRADVPFKAYKSVASANDARIVAPSTGVTVLASELGGHRMAQNSSAGGSAGYVPVTFTIKNDGRLIPGEAVEVYLMADGSRQALTVPASAIVEQQGDFFVFVRLDEDCYRKMPIRVGASNGSEVEILSGLNGGEAVVSHGVTAIKLAQSSGNVPEGHSHSH